MTTVNSIYFLLEGTSMRLIGLTLSFLLFLNPLLIVASETPAPKQKTLYKSIVGDVSKLTSALLKSGAGLAFALAGAAALSYSVAATLDSKRGYKSVDTTIELNILKNNGTVEQQKYSFNAWPLICVCLATFGTSSFGLALLSFNSAKNDLQSINEESIN